MAATRIRLLLDPPPKAGVCRGCRAPIDWYRTTHGRAMPMNGGAKPMDAIDGPPREGVFASADSHWATCPKREQFKKSAPPHRAYFGSDFDPVTSRWSWTITEHTNNHAKEVGRSVITYPTQHDANVAAKALLKQLTEGSGVLWRENATPRQASSTTTSSPSDRTTANAMGTSGRRP